MTEEMEWKPIEDLPDNWRDLAHDELSALAQVWKEQKAKLEKTQAYQTFLDQMRRKIAIETGIIERLYSIDRGITQILIERGIDEALIPHGSTDRSASEIVALIRDQESAIGHIFDFVGSQRDLSTSYIKQLHQFLTRNQDYTDAVDQFGYLSKTELIRGDWKKSPNNPKRNGTMHVYCPPEQVASQMDTLLAWHQKHLSEGVNPEVEAAWLHHRFTQIHPFQDGNGRVARLIASLVLIRAGWFPLVITRDERVTYIDALEKADAGDLKPLVDLFARVEIQAFISSLSLSEQVLTEGVAVKNVLDAIRDTLKRQQETSQQDALVENYASILFRDASQRFNRLEVEIKQIVGDVSKTISTTLIGGDGPGHPYQEDIAELALLQNYHANLQGYKTWVRLVILTGKANLIRQLNLFLSFHHVGVEPSGIMSCAAFAVFDTESPQDRTLPFVLSPRKRENLAQEPFFFTALEDESKLKERFSKWLEDVIIVGLEFWRKTL